MYLESEKESEIIEEIFELSNKLYNRKIKLEEFIKSIDGVAKK